MSEVQHIFGDEVNEIPASPTMISEINKQFLKGNSFYVIAFGKIAISFTPKKNNSLLRAYSEPLYDSEQIVMVGNEPIKTISRIDALKLILENTSLENDMNL